MSRFFVAAFVLVFGLCGATSAKAGARPPCISATQSANGNALVVNELTLSGRDGDSGRKVEASTFRIFRSYRDLNAGLRVNGPDKYWADPMWELAFTWGKSPSAGCPYALVTDDAEHLVLLGQGSDRVALSIYRRDDRPRPTGQSGRRAACSCGKLLCPIFLPKFFLRRFRFGTRGRTIRRNGFQAVHFRFQRMSER